MREPTAAEIGGAAITNTRSVEYLRWVVDTGRPLPRTDAEVAALRSEYYRLPYETRAKYYIRPTKAGAEVAGLVLRTRSGERELAALDAYRKSSDAYHAMRQLGVRMDRNALEKAQSRSEISEVELAGATRSADSDPESAPFDHIGGPLEFYEQQATDNHLYEQIGWTQPSFDPARLVTAADTRERLYNTVVSLVSREDLAIFLLAAVDGVAYRRIAHEFHTSKSAIARTVARVRAVVRAAFR